MKQKFALDLGITLAKEESLKSQKKYGSYHIKHYNNEFDHTFIIKYEELNMKLIKHLKSVINFYLKMYHVQKLLIIGLGNESLNADSLGIKVIKKISNNNTLSNISDCIVINPIVINNTGFTSFHLIEKIVDSEKIDLIIVIDSLITTNINYLNHTIEINNHGLIPSSLLNGTTEINQKTFNIPILTIGAPIVLAFDNTLLTNIYNGTYIDLLSDYISKALNDIINHIMTK